MILTQGVLTMIIGCPVCQNGEKQLLWKTKLYPANPPKMKTNLTRKIWLKFLIIRQSVNCLTIPIRKDWKVSVRVLQTRAKIIERVIRSGSRDEAARAEKAARAVNITLEFLDRLQKMRLEQK